jgi:LysM repeat protein
MPLDPQLQALQQSLNAAISGGQLVLNSASMGPGSAPVVALFTQAFGRADITIGGTIAITPDDVNDRLIVSGTGVTALFNVTGMAVLFTFGSATSTTLSLTGSITPPAQPVWNFSTSFPDLAYSFFDQLAFTTPFFTISTYAWRNAAWNVTVVEGAGLSILPTGLTGPLAPAAQLANPPLPLPPFYGPVTQTADRRLALAMPFPDVTLDIRGFPQLQFPSPTLVLRNDQPDGSLMNASAMTVEAAVNFGFVEAPLAIVLPYVDGWALDLIPVGAQPIPSVTSFLALFTGIDLSSALPASLVSLPGFWLSTLNVQFDLDTGVSGSWLFAVTTAPEGQPPSATVWSVFPGVLEIRELTVILQVATVRPGGRGTPQTRITGSITGLFHIGGTVDIRIVIPIPITEHWFFTMSGAVALPSLRDLTKLVAGVDLNTLLPPGVGNIGGFTLTGITLVLDPVKPMLVQFSFELVSTNDWTIIPNRLALRNLLLRFQIDDPFTLRNTSGVIAGTLQIGAWNIDVVVQRAPLELDWSLQVTSDAMPLPSIADLDQLVSAPLAPYLPQTLATASFTLYNLLIDVNLTQTQIRQIAFQLESDQAWTILADVLVIKRAGLTVDVSWFTGDLLANFGIWGSLEIVSTGIDVSADRQGEGIWTFRGALAAGETISLTGLVRQFIPFLPAYLPTLEVEGLAVTFTTPSNDYHLEGRTAGLWTFEVSSALTLKMQAAAAFSRTDGKMSGLLAGSFFVNSLELFVSYAFDPTSSTLIFRITYGRFVLTAALTSGTNAKGDEFSLLSFRLGDLSFGEILEALINLAAPGRQFTLSSPWNALNQINLRNLSFVVDLKTRAVTVTYDITLNLVFINITSIGLKYDTSSGEGSVKIELSGRFLDQEYSIAHGTPLEWDVLHEPPPSVPAKGPELFDLRYLGLGQHVSFTSIAALNSVGEAIAALRAEMKPAKDATRNPLATGNGSGMRFDRASGVLVGADFTLLSTLSASFVFNDPYLYGLRLALAGERAGSLAGLSFELLYKKITNDIGVFKIELRVPDAFRQLEFGEVSITLPIIKVDVYTNGNFRVDLGFPRGGDFSDAFCLQVFPFIGWGGFYFAALTGATSEKVPRITNGTFDPVIEFGVGLQVGLGKEIRKGPLSGGIYVTVVGILEGTVAWFTPNDAAALNGMFYRVEGMIGIVGKVYGSVDFAVIKVSVRLEARLTVRLTLEAYQATTVQVTVEVEAEASVKVFFIRINFSFKVKLDEQFVIGSSSRTPWLVDDSRAVAAALGGGQPRLRMQQTQWLPRPRVRELRLRARSTPPAAATFTPWDPILMFATKKDLPLSLLPALTVATPAGSTTPAVQIDFLLLAENGVSPAAVTRAELQQATAAHSTRTTDPMELSFNLLVEAMLQWAIYSVTGSLTGNVTAGDLERAYALLEDPATFTNGFSLTNLTAFFAANFNVQISGLPPDAATADTTSSTVMAMLPALSYTFGLTTVDFGVYQPVSPDYEARMRQYYDQLLVDYDYGRAVDPALHGANAAGGDAAAAARVAETVAGDESMAALIFREYMMIVARAAVQGARDCLTEFQYPVTDTDSLDSIVTHFPPVQIPHVARRGETIASIARLYGMTPQRLAAMNADPAGAYAAPPRPGASVDAELAVTPQSIAWTNRDVAVTPNTPWTLNDLMYQVNAGDSLSGVATTLFGLSGPSALIALVANAANRQLLAEGAAMTIAQPASGDYTWFIYTSVAGDNLAAVAVWAFVRALPDDPQANGPWYAQTIVNFNTDAQHPYAGPDLTGVIATGTPLLVPAALNDTNKAHAITYVTRAGDTLTLVSAYFDVLQNAPASLTPLETGLRTLNPGVDWLALPAGTAIKIPAQTWHVASGDSWSSIATRFRVAATDLAAGGNVTSTTLLSPLAVLAIPPVTYTTGAADTIATVAERFNTTVAAIATDVAAVSGLFLYPVSLIIPDVPAYPIASLVSAVVLGPYANEAAMSTSRFVASGLRLPTPLDETVLDGLYLLTGQQTPCPTPPATYTFSTTAPWITFVDSLVTMPDDSAGALRARHARLDALNPALPALTFRPGLHLLTDTALTLDITITQALLDTYAPSTTFDPHILSGPSPLDIKQRTPVTYRLDRNIHWQTPQTVPFGGSDAAPSTGEPSIWLFSQALADRAAALGWGTTPFALFTAAGDPAITPSTDAVGRYDWATLVNLSVRQAASTEGAAPLPTTYEIAGSDADGKARLLALLNYLTGPGSADTAQIFILWQPNADTNNPNGLASASVTAASTFLLRTNLSTVTASGPHGSVLTAAPQANLYAATIAQATNFIQLLWEASVTASAGYLLNYTDASGNGLPASLFAASPLGELRILVLLTSQSAGAAPDRKLYAFNNCAVVGDNIDASRQTVFVAVDDAAKTEWSESASIPPGNVGFALTRQNPGETDDAATRTQQLYSLLAYSTLATPGFTASHEGLPVSPDRPDATATTLADGAAADAAPGDGAPRDGAPADEAVWRYSQVLRLAKLTTSTLPVVPYLPAAANDPYAGITPSATITLAMDFHDVYGNETVSQAPLANLLAPVGYYDDVIGLAQWPGIATSYGITGSAAAPAVEIDAALQVSNYVPGGGTSFDAAQRNASAHRTRLEAVYYQIWQDGVSLTLTTSLVEATAGAPTPFPVDRIAFATFVNAAYIFLGLALQYRPATQTAGAGTLQSIAQALTADVKFLADTIGALGVANQAVPTASLFAAPLAMPELSTAAFGDTLTTIVTRAGAPAVTVVQLATNNAAVGLNAGIDISAPARTSPPATATTRLTDIAAAMHANVGAIGTANAATQGLLAEGAKVVVDQVTIIVAVDPISQKTWSLNDLVPKFSDQGVTATPAIIAVANQDLAGLVAAGQTLTVTDYIIQAGDTFTTLQQAYPAFTIAALATAAAASPNIFVAGAPLFIRTGAPVPPSNAQTMSTLAEIYGLTAEQIAVANQTTMLVSTASVFLPDRVTIDAGAPAALAPYATPATGLSVNAIVQTFGEASALRFATRNWTPGYIFIPQQTIAVGAASTPTQAADSFDTVYTRLHAQDSSITQQLFIDTIAPTATLLRAGALFATLLPSTGAAVTTLQDLSNRFGADASLIAQVNASLVGFVAAGATVTLGPLSLTTGANETFTNLVLRFAQEFDAQTTVGALATANLTVPLVAAQQRFVLPPASLSTRVALPAPPAQNPPYPGNPFRLLMDLVIARDSTRIDPQFAAVPSVATATTQLGPYMTAPADGAAMSLDAFAQALEGVYPGLKVAVGGDSSSDSATRDVWIVNFGPGGITSVTIDSASPSFFALPPLATSLQDLTGIPIRAFDPATGTLVPANDPPLFDFQSIDLDVWASIVLDAIDQTLAPSYAAPAYGVNASAFTQIVAAKQTLAERISAAITPILTGSSGVTADAAERLRQQLLFSLGAGYAVAAVVQYPVTAASSFTTSATAPRLVGALVDRVFRTRASDDLVSLAAFYGLPQAAIAMLLADVVRILQAGTTITFKQQSYVIADGETIAALMLRVGALGFQDFVSNLQTPNGFFLPYTVLNIDRVDGKSGDATASAALLTLADLVDYFHTPLPLLAASIQEKPGLFIDGVTISVPDHGSITISASNNSLALAAAALHFDDPYLLALAIELTTGILDPQFVVRVVRFVPEHTLSSAKISLYNGASTMNALFDVKSESRAKNMFLRLDTSINELEYDIVPVANAFQASRWLSFVVPIAETTTPIKTDLGEVLIPIPLRAYPVVPSMIEQSGVAASEAPVDIATAKQWAYGFSYQNRLAAQDTLYVETTFNLPLAGTLAANALTAGFRGALAQFVSAWPALFEALGGLASWNGAPNAVLAQTLQTFADLATTVANGWTPASAAGAEVVTGTTYRYQMQTTVRADAAGLVDFLDTLRVQVLSGQGPSPTGQFPRIEWRRADGDWRPLELRLHTATDAVYGYVEEVPAEETIQHRLTFDAVDVVAWQNGSGSARLTRNERLVSRAATAPVFVYGTSQIGFAQPAVPLIQHDDVLLFNDGLTLLPALQQLFTTLLGPAATAADYWVKLSVEFGYEVVATDPPVRPLVSFLPIGLLPTSQYDTGLPQRVYDLITAWRVGKPFTATQGLFALDVTVFTTLTPPAASRVPILRLQHLVYANSPAAGAAAERLWRRRAMPRDSRDAVSGES